MPVRGAWSPEAVSDAYVDFYRQQFEWQLYCCFTFPCRRSEAGAAFLFRSFVKELGRFYKAPIGWLRATETGAISGVGRPESDLHYHAVLSCCHHMDPIHVRDCWKQIAGWWDDNAWVKPYEPAQNGCQYMMKWLYEPGCELDCGDLDLYQRWRTESWCRNARQRRRFRRQTGRCSRVALQAA